MVANRIDLEDDRGFSNAPRVPLVQHRGESIEFYTPRAVVEAARRTLEVIDFDPCSCAAAQEVIKARSWIGLPTDGLDAEWPKGARMLVNPPGGTSRTTKVRNATMTTEQAKRYGTTSTAAAWWRRTAVHVWMTRGAAVFIGFNIEIVRNARPVECCPFGPLDWAHCVPDERLAFDRINADGLRESAGSPSHANVIVCVGDHAVRERFAEAFSGFGRVRNVGR